MGNVEEARGASIDLEHWWVTYIRDLGVVSAQALRKAGRASSDEILRAPINRAVREIHRGLIDRVFVRRGGNYTENATYLMKLCESMEIMVLCHLIVVGAVNHLLCNTSRETTLAAVGGHIVKVVEEELRIRFMEKAVPELTASINKRTKHATFVHRKRALMTSFHKATKAGLPHFFADQDTKNRVAVALVECCLMAPSLFSLSQVMRGRGRKVNCLQIRPEILGLFNRAVSVDTFAPLVTGLGLYHHPVPVNRDDFNGYLLKRKPLVRHNWLGGKWNPPVFESSAPKLMVKRLNNVAYRINKRMITWIETHQKRLTAFGIIPNLELKIPVDVTKRAAVFDAWHKGASKRRTYFRTLALARRLDDDLFYHDWFLDFRGRMYTTNTLLSPQGSQLSKALIKFGTEVLIERGTVAWDEWHEAGMRMVLGGKCDLRGKSLDILQPLVQAVVDGSLKPSQIDSEKEFLPFVAWALETDELWRMGKLRTGVMIRRDATASSVQHMATMAGDVYLMNSVNLFSYTPDAPSDLYTNLQQRVDLSRADIKQHVMTYAYNSTAYGRVTERKKNGAKGSYRDLMAADKVVELALNRELGSLAHVRDEIGAYGEANDFQFTSPSGIKFDGRNVTYPSERLFVRYNGHRMAVRMKTPKDPELNIRKTRASFVANVVHSFDASLLHMGLTDTGLGPVATIHDCVCTLPGFMERTCVALRRSFFVLHKKLQILDSKPNLDYNAYTLNSRFMFV